MCPGVCAARSSNLRKRVFFGSVHCLRLCQKCSDICWRRDALYALRAFGILSKAIHKVKPQHNKQCKTASQQNVSQQTIYNLVLSPLLQDFALGGVSFAEIASRPSNFIVSQHR